MHPNFNAELLDYDAAILTLRNLIRYDATKQPIRLPFLNEVLPTGNVVATSGWGMTQNSNESTLALRLVELTVTNQLACHNLYIDDGGGITPRMVCAGAEGKDSCDGGELLE
jgi:hypothetical protein